MAKSINESMLRNIGGTLLNSLQYYTEIDDVDENEEEPQVLQASPYYNDEMLCNLLVKKRKVFKCLSLNIQSLNAKIDELKIYLEILKQSDCCFDAILVQETWLNQYHDLSRFQIENYTLVTKPYHSSTHGGLAIYIHKNITYEVLNIPDSKSNIWEGQFIRVKLEKTNLTIGNIYRPPRDLNENYQTFTKEFNLCLKSLQDEVLVGGDFNIDLLKIKEKAAIGEYFESILSSGFIPKITLPTRLSVNRGSLIDNFLCKMSKNFSNASSGIIASKISDHQPYFICLDYLKNTSTCSSKYIKITYCNDKAIADLTSFLQNSDISSKLSHDRDINTNYKILNDIIEKGLNKYIPVKYVKFKKHKHKKSKWITKGLIRSIAFRDKLYQKTKSTPISSPLYNQLKENLQSYNKMLRKLIQSAKSDYYSSRFSQYKSDMKNTWVTIKEIINKCEDKRNFPEYFIVQEKKILDQQDIVNNFNSYFAKIGPELAATIPPLPNQHFSDYLLTPHQTAFYFQAVSQTEIIKVIDSLKSKTSAGYDRLSSVLLKQIKTPLIVPLQFLINQSISNGIFPDLLKIAKIFPVYKKDNIHSITNYRPISILPTISKVFEKVIFHQLHNFLKEKKLYNNNQYGFRELHSTEHAALELVDRIINELDNSQNPIAVFIDLSKAFDTINHEILIKKLDYYGIRNKSLSLLKSYLSNRKQYVEINDTKSSFANIKTGVPQGSILGPLLFIIYINDISLASKLFKTITYADDTTLFVSISTTKTSTSPSIQSINNELHKYINWLRLNALSLNEDKTKCILFTTQNKVIDPPTIILNGKQIENVSKFDFLGVTIDRYLRWHEHIDKISSKISKVIGILCHLRKTLPLQILKLIYNSLINPHLQYGILCWGTQNERIIMMQKKAVRIITNSRFNAHGLPLLKKLSILSIPDLYNSKLLRFYYRYKKNRLPQYFSTFKIIKQRDSHQRLTRNDKFLTNRVNHTFAENCARYNLPHLLNETSDDILDKISTHSELGFKLYIKNSFLNDYPDGCTLSDCGSCNYEYE